MFSRAACAVGVHRWHTVNATACFATEYIDRPEWLPIRHMVWYEQCARCNKRRMRDTVKKDSLYGTGRHVGVELARVDWVEKGRMYLGTSHNSLMQTRNNNRST